MLLNKNWSINKSKERSINTLRQIKVETQHTKIMRYNKTCVRRKLKQQMPTSRNKEISNKQPTFTPQGTIKRRKGNNAQR